MAGKVLIIEKHDEWRKNLREEFESLGWQVVGVTNSRDEALRLFAEHQPDLVTFATMNEEGYWPGLDIATEIRKRDSKIPIVPITAWRNFKFEGTPGVHKYHFKENLRQRLAELFPEAEAPVGA